MLLNQKAVKYFHLERKQHQDYFEQPSAVQSKYLQTWQETCQHLRHYMGLVSVLKFKYNCSLQIDK